MSTDGRGVLPTALRRSAALLALPALIAVTLAHVLARDRSWSHEWLWAFYQYQFVTVLLGPLLAGVAAWEGVRLASARDLIGTGNRPQRALAQAWLAVTLWGLLAYIVGLATAVGLVLRTGVPGAPGPAAFATIAPAVSLLAAEVAVGLAAGWWLRHLVAAPVAAVGCFLATLWMYVAGPSQLIIVGGATSSLIRLAPRPTLEAWQTAYFAACAVLALVLAVRLAGWGRRPGSWQAPASCGVVVIALAGLLQQGDTLLHVVDQPLVCVGTAPSVCVAPGYTAQAATARTALLPYLAAISDLGIAVPTTFRQNVEPGQRTVGTVEAGLLLGDGRSAGYAVLGSLISKACPIGSDARLQADFSGLSYWLYATVNGERNAGPDVPVIATGPSTPAQRAWLVQAATALTACGR